jgi:hypothetical protein
MSIEKQIQKLDVDEYSERDFQKRGPFSANRGEPQVRGATRNVFGFCHHQREKVGTCRIGEHAQPWPSLLLVSRRCGILYYGIF